MKKVFITEKGAKLQPNFWNVGMEISCHENLAKDFIERGIATEEMNQSTEAETPKQKTKSKK